MKRSHFLLSVFIFPLVACSIDHPATGTNDEVTTSLQMLADNVKSIGSASSLAARKFAGRAMMGGPSDTGRWIAFDFVDHSRYSVWQLQWNGTCQNVSGTDECIATDRQMINDLPGLTSYTNRWSSRGTQLLSVASISESWRRSGFKYFLEDSSHADTILGTWITDRSVMTFPGMDIRIPLRTGRQDSLLMHLTSIPEIRLPILKSGVQIGILVQQGIAGPRWFDMSGKEYHGAPLPSNSFGPDSLGIHLTQARWDSLGDVPGIRLTGWYHMPDSLGMAQDSIWAMIEGDCSGTRCAWNFGRVAPEPDGRINYFIPQTDWSVMRASQHGANYTGLRLVTKTLTRSLLEQGVREPSGDNMYSDSVILK